MRVCRGDMSRELNGCVARSIVCIRSVQGMNWLFRRIERLVWRGNPMRTQWAKAIDVRIRAVYM
jgi:hypothetical protein